MEILAASVGGSTDEAIRQIEAFQHVRSTSGAEACPASWEPGQAGIKISTDLVGNLRKVWKPKGM